MFGCLIKMISAPNGSERLITSFYIKNSQSSTDWDPWIKKLTGLENAIITILAAVVNGEYRSCRWLTPCH